MPLEIPAIDHKKAAKKLQSIMKTEGFEPEMIKSMPNFKSSKFRRPSVDGGAQTCGPFPITGKPVETVPQAKKRRGISNQSTRKIIGGASRRDASIDKSHATLDHQPKIIVK